MPLQLITIFYPWGHYCMFAYILVWTHNSVPYFGGMHCIQDSRGSHNYSSIFRRSYALMLVFVYAREVYRAEEMSWHLNWTKRVCCPAFGVDRGCKEFKLRRWPTALYKDRRKPSLIHWLRFGLSIEDEMLAYTLQSFSASSPSTANWALHGSIRGRSEPVAAVAVAAAAAAGITSTADNLLPLRVCVAFQSKFKNLDRARSTASKFRHAFSPPLAVVE